MACGQPHPEDSLITCDLKGSNHPTCRGWSFALDDYRDWANESYVEPKRVDPSTTRSRLGDLSTRVTPAVRVDQKFVEEPRLADFWSAEQMAHVREVITAMARCREEFTSDDIWDELARSVPLVQACMVATIARVIHERVIDDTGKRVASRRDEKRIPVWYSFMNGSTR